MDSRRRFIGQVATGLAGTIAAPVRVLGANERIRLGVIGSGERGMQLVREGLACPNTELAAAADVYQRRLEEVKALFPSIRTFSDYRRMLDDKSVDAVLIATPQHLHCEHFIGAMEAGKHVYLEKTMAFSVDQAKRMQAVYRKAGKQTVQIGHQPCSSGHVTDAQNFLRVGLLGKITSIRAHMYRNTPHGRPQWARPVYPDMTSESIEWNAFLGAAQPRPFDANRFANWRYFWDYSGGNFYENLCQQLAFWYKVLGLEIPRAVTASGGVFLWKDGREVPDTMNVAMEHGEEILFTWDSGFGNNYYGSAEEALGTDGTISRNQQIRYLPQKINKPDGAELLGRTRTGPNAHMQDFLECVRSGREPNCPFDLGYRVAIACRMAVESYKQGRTMRWDPAREEFA